MRRHTHTVTGRQTHSINSVNILKIHLTQKCLSPDYKMFFTVHSSMSGRFFCLALPAGGARLTDASFCRYFGARQRGRHRLPSRRVAQQGWHQLSGRFFCLGSSAGGARLADASFAVTLGLRAKDGVARSHAGRRSKDDAGCPAVSFACRRRASRRRASFVVTSGGFAARMASPAVALGFLTARTKSAVRPFLSPRFVRRRRSSRRRVLRCYAGAARQGRCWSSGRFFRLVCGRRSSRRHVLARHLQHFNKKKDCPKILIHLAWACLQTRLLLKPKQI